MVSKKYLSEVIDKIDNNVLFSYKVLLITLFGVASILIVGYLIGSKSYRIGSYAFAIYWFINMIINHNMLKKGLFTYKKYKLLAYELISIYMFFLFYMWYKAVSKPNNISTVEILPTIKDCILISAFTISFILMLIIKSQRLSIVSPKKASVSFVALSGCTALVAFFIQTTSTINFKLLFCGLVFLINMSYFLAFILFSVCVILQLKIKMNNKYPNDI